MPTTPPQAEHQPVYTSSNSVPGQIPTPLRDNQQEVNTPPRASNVTPLRASDASEEGETPTNAPADFSQRNSSQHSQVVAPLAPSALSSSTAAAAAAGDGSGQEGHLATPSSQHAPYYDFKSSDNNSPSPNTKKKNLRSMIAEGGGGGDIAEKKLEYHPILGVPFFPNEPFARTSCEKFDPEFGAPFEPNFPAIQAKNHKAIEYDDFFGAPVRKGRFQKPTGKPKRAGDIKDPNEAANKEIQQKQYQERIAEQQRQRAELAQQKSMTANNNAGGMGYYGNQGDSSSYLKAFAHDSSAAANPSSGSGITGNYDNNNNHEPAKQQQQLQQQQVLFLAKQLGIDAAKEQYLLPVAMEGMTMPLPDGWVRQQDPKTGNIFYGNTNTKAVDWNPPHKEILLAKLKAAREKGPGQQVPSGASTPSASAAAASASSGPLIHQTSATQQQQQQQQQAQPQQIHPNHPAVVFLAKQLNIDLQKETSLIPIVMQGVVMPIPAPWVRQQDQKNGLFFFGNMETKAVSWNHPCKDDLLAKITAARTSAVSVPNHTPSAANANEVNVPRHEVKNDEDNHEAESLKESQAVM